MTDRCSISEVTVKNFKAFAEKRQHMPLKPLTLVYGPNSSGKSSLLQAVALAREAVINGAGTLDAHKTQLVGQAIDLGGFQQYVHRREMVRNVNLGFRLDLATNEQVFIEFVIGFTPDMESQLPDDLIYTKHCSVRQNGRIIVSFQFDQSGMGTLEAYDRDHRYFSRGNTHSYHVEVPRGKLFPDFDSGNSTKNKVWLSDSCPRLIDRIKTVFSRDLRSMLYLGPLRYFPDRDFANALNNQNPDWISGGAWTWDHICKNEELRDIINEWLSAKDRLRTPYRLAVHRLGELSESDGTGLHSNSLPMDRLRLIDMRTNTTVSHKDVGIGVSQILPILATTLSAEGALIAIEQPELHLHPAIQAELADVFLCSALQRKNTVVVETHSEVLVLRILRRIRESTESAAGYVPRLGVRPDDVCVIYVQPTDSGSRVLEIPLTSDGEFGETWPDGFFPEQSQELF